MNTFALDSDSGLVHLSKVTDRVAVLRRRWRTAAAAFVIALAAVVVAGVAARAATMMADEPTPDSLIWPAL